MSGGTYNNNVYAYIILSYNPATLTSTGTVSDSGTGIAVQAAVAGQTFTNYGTIIASLENSYGILLASGGVVVNGAASNTSAFVTGGGVGIELQGAAGAVINYASISGTLGDGIVIAQGGTVINNGTIASIDAAAVGFSNGGVVTNGQGGVGGLIIGNNYGVYVGGAAGAVANYGTIEGAAFTGSIGDGVALKEGGLVTNTAATGVISGYSKGVYLDGAAGTFVNAGIVTTDGDNSVGVLVATGGTVTNDIGGTIGGIGYGVVLGDGGVVVNSAGAVISGNYKAVYFRYQAATLVNAGTVVGVGGASDGVVLLSGGYVANSDPAALITGAYAGVAAFGQPATVVNSGVIEATLSGNASPLIGVNLAAGGVINNYGTIVGGGTYSQGVQLENGGYLSNTGSNALIAGYDDGVVVSGVGTVVNYGTISGTGSSGTAGTAIDLTSGGFVSNAATGLIDGKVNAILIGNQPGTVVNAGTIVSPLFEGIVLGFGGSVTNTSAGFISGFDGIVAFADATVANSGTISGGGSHDGVYLDVGGGVNNAAAALIVGGLGGVYVSGGAGTVINGGTIAGTGTNGRGVVLLSGGYVSNAATGVIEGVFDGVHIDNAGGTVINYGTIGEASQSGIALLSGGVVENGAPGTAGATVYGAYHGVFVIRDPGTITNYGTIAAANGAVDIGVFLGAGGAVDNAAGAVIYGGRDGVYASGGLGTISNYGTIVGAAVGARGIEFDSGGAVTNASAGTISSDYRTVEILGTRGEVVNLGTIIVDDPSASSLDNPDATTLRQGGVLINGASTDTTALLSAEGYSQGAYFGNFRVSYTNASGTVVNYGTISNQRYAGIVMSQGGTVDNLGSIVSTDGEAMYIRYGYVGNSGLISSYFDGVRSFAPTLGNLLTVVNQGTIASIGTAGVGVHLQAGGAVVNYGTIIGGSSADGIALNAGGAVTNGTAGVTTALITGGYLGIYIGGAGTILNYGTIVATGASGHGMRITGAATIDNLGTITGPGSGFFLDTSGLIVNGQSGATAGLIVGTLGFSANGGAGAGPTTVVNYGTIAGEGSGALSIALAGTVVNFGTIIDTGTAATSVGVGINDGGVVVNGSNGGPASLIEAANYAISLDNISATVTNYGTVIAGHVAIDADAPLVEITNFGTVIGTTGFGVYVDTGGTVTNHGLILGYDQGVHLAQVAGTLVNYGTIAGTGTPSDAVVMYAGLLVNSAGGLLTGPGYGAKIGGGAGTVINYGTIVTTGVNNNALRLMGGGLVENSGLISGTGSGDGVFLDAAATVTNAGTIIGRTGVADGSSSPAPGQVVNYATIIGTGGNGVYQIGGGVTNTVSGVITGYADAVVIASSAGVVDNLGTIESTGPIADGVALYAGGTVTNYGAILAVGVSFPTGVYLATGGLVENFGTVASPSDVGISLPNGGTIVNEAGALLQGIRAVEVDGTSGGTVTNAGTIAGTANGVLLKAAGGVVFNAGVVDAKYAVFLYAGGVATNTATGYISGYKAILGTNSAATVANYGTMVGGSSGAGGGIELGFGGSTVINGGTIVGGTALLFTGAGNLLVVDPGATFAGNVYGGGGGSDELELAGSSAVTGYIGGLGSQFFGFDQIAVDSGANWQATGSNALAAGVTLADAGTLAFASPLTNFGELGIGAGATLALAQGAAGSGDIVFAGANGVLTIGGAAMPTNTISGIAPGDQIDLTALPWSAGASAYYIAATQQLVVSAGGLVDTLAATGVVAGTLFDVTSDGQGGSLVEATAAGSGMYFGGIYTSGIVLRTAARQNPATIGPSGYVTNSSGSYSGDGVYGLPPTAWTLTNYGTINATAAGSDGVALAAGGYVINGGRISGANDGILISGATGTVANTGTVVAGSNNASVYLGDGGSINNTGLVLGVGTGIFIGNATGTVSNSGAVILTGTGNAIQLFAGGLVNNAGLVEGGDSTQAAIGVHTTVGTIINSGTIAGANSGNAVDLTVGGLVNNGTSGLLTGYAAAVDVTGASGTIVNNGTLVGSTGAGVYLGAGGAVSNGASGSSNGLVSGYADGVEITGADGNVSNFGVIVGAGASGDGVRLIVGGSVDNFGLITATFEAVEIDGALAVVTNYGTIEASGSSGAGVRLLAGGDITNTSGGYINGPANGINVNGATGTVFNLGSIGNGIYLTAGGYVNNQGNITGLVQAVAIGHAVGTVVNSGAIDGNGTNSGGIYLTAGGGVTNAQSGIISGSVIGVEIGAGTGNAGIPGTVVNLGTIDGGSNTGVWVAEGGVIVNGQPGVAGALITAGADGAATGYQSTGGVGSVVNYGTIVGPNVAVFLEAGGVVTNAGLISGGGGIDVTVTAGIVDNYGTAIGTVFDAVYLRDGGSVVNGAGALLQGADYGVHISTAAGTIVNLGEIASTTTSATGRAVELGDGGFIANYGLIIGGHIPAPYYPGAITVLGAVATVLNTGTVASTNGGDGVDLVGGGTIGNGAAGSTAALITASHFALYTGGNTGTANGSGGVVTNYGTITSQQTAVVLESGGTMVNESTGVLAGGSDAIIVHGSAGIIVNSGAITSQSSHAIYLGAGGYVKNFGDILTASMSHAGISFHNAAGAVSNSGTIASVGNQGVYFQDGGSVTNAAAGLVTGGADGIDVLNAAGTVVNSGIVESTAITSGVAIYFAQSGVLTNQAGGLITAYRDGIVAKGASASAITNYGAILSTGTDFAAVYLGAGGVVSNQAGGLIDGLWDGIDSKNIAGTVVNFGIIESAATFGQLGTVVGGAATFHSVGVLLQQGGLIINGAPGATTAQIIAYEHAIYIGGGAGIPNPGAIGTVINYGAIAGTGTNGYAVATIELSSGGTIENFGTITSAASNAIDISGTVAATISNFGLIENFTSVHAAIYSSTGGIVTNAAGALIASGKPGISFNDTIGTTISFGSVINAGTIESTGTGPAVYFGQGGVVTNQLGGLITALHNGIRATIDPATVVNYGAIQGSGANYAGVALGAGGLIINSGAISGGGDGIYANGVAAIVNNGLIVGNAVGIDMLSAAASSTVVNAGTIIGAGGTALSFNGASNLLVLDPGATFAGNVYGGGAGTDVLALTGVAGYIGGLGSQFSGFDQIAVYQGGVWTATGANTIGGGTTLTDAGALTFVNAVTDDGALDIGAAATLTLANGANGGGDIAFVGADGLLAIGGTAMPANTISGFTFGDVIDLQGVAGGGGGFATLGAENVLTVEEGGQSFFLQFDPAQNFAGDSFVVTGDSASGTDILLTSASATVVSAGETLTVIAGEVLSNVIVLAGGTLDVAAGGTVVDTQIAAGGTEIVEAGGLDVSATVDSGGVMDVFGSATLDLVLGGGSQTVEAGGVVFDAVLDGAAVQTVFGVASNSTVSAGDSLIVESGGIAGGATIDTGGSEIVNAGGTANTTLVFAGGAETVSVGGSDFNAVIAGGTEQVFGTANTAIVVSGGGIVVAAGGLIDSATIDTSGTLELAAGSTAAGILNFGSIGGDLQIDGTTMPTAPIAGFTIGDTIDLRGIGFVAGMSATFDSNTDTLTLTGGDSNVQLTLSGVASGTQFAVVSDGQGGSDIVEASAAGNLILNGDFEDSTSTTTTPPFWTNIGHEDGVIAYAQFPSQPVYQGAEFYDLGGFGEPQPPVGDGIEQTVATTPGDTYTLTFGLGQENQSGTEILQVAIGSQVTDYTLVPTGTGVFTDPFTTQTIQYVATGASTTIAFTIADNSPTTGSNDPLIDGVSFAQSSGPPSANLFGFIFTYNDGKSYYDGVVADNGSFGYFVGQRINTSAGFYQIIQNLGATSFASGAVVVTSYSYNQPGQASPVPIDTAKGVPDGIAGLGSESDAVLGTDGQVHAFSSTQEATFAATPLFSFVYSYADGNFYTGTVADSGTFRVTPGTTAVFNSSGAVVGTYTIFADGTTAAASGTVVVNSVVLDGQSFVPAQALSGTGGLGSEFGTITVNGQAFVFTDQVEPNVVPSISTAPITITTTDPTTAEVDQIFSDLLARAPTSSELATASSLLENGASTTAVRQDLEVPGSEGQNDLNQVFEQLFNQAIDPADNATYTNLLIQGSSLAAVQLMLAQSPTAVAEIEALYEQDFDQTITPELLASMEAILGDSGGSMNEVADILSTSAAAQPALSAMFTATAARSPDAAELAGMEAQLTNGTTETELQATLVTEGSAGGYTIVTAPNGNAVLAAQSGTPAQFVFDDLSFGVDTIAGFDPSEDAIALPQSLAGSFAALQGLMSATASGTLITFGSNQSILIEGVAPGSLTGSNFYFDGSAGGGGSGLGINVLPYALTPGADFFSDGTADPLWRNAGTGSVLLWHFAPDSALYATQILGTAGSGWALQGAADFTGDGGASILWRDASTGDVSLWNPIGDASLTYTAQDLGTVGLNWTIEGAGDFTGDGKASILWRDANTGDVQLWTSNPGNSVSFGIQDLGYVGSDWQVAGIGSFTGNGLADILWRNTTSGDTQVWAYNQTTGTFSARDLGISGLNWTMLGVADFNGDGVSDIMWQNSATGDVVLWDSGPGGSYTAQDLGVVGPNWTFLSAGDYSGNGEADILWQNADGDVQDWASNPPPVAFAPQNLGSVSPQWNAAATSDFSADGMTDIVWRNAGSGDVSLWSANPGSALSFTPVDAGYAAANWTIQGTGDFTGNGDDDILWRDANSGDVQLWNASTGGGGEPSFTTQDLGIVGADWTIEGAGDFTGDGKASILWLNTGSGDVSLWQSNPGSGASFTPVDLGPVGVGWAYAGAGDFTGNGSDDILWRNANSGDLSLWEGTPGSASFTPQDLGIVSPDWSLEGVGDFNGDGKADILWQNTTTGDLNLWESNPGAGVSFTIDDLGTAPPGQTIVQIGDFEGSGRAGILWEDSAGNLTLWNQNAGSPSFTAHDLGIVANTI
jgi:FG-GAP-like repeat